MSEEEPNLSACMQNLKIMPRPKPAKTYRDEELPLKLNPFARKHKQTKSQSELLLFGPSCSCKKRRISRNTAFKRPTNRNKILREPIIVYIDECSHIPNKKIDCKMMKQKETTSAKALRFISKNSKLFGENMTQQDFKSIIAGCEQLSLSGSGGGSYDLPCFSSLNFRESRHLQQQRLDRANTNNNISNTNNNNSNVNSSSSCSQQAMARLCLNPPPCDVTIDELASYFETFVHIPKKMSSMAEMMYI